MSKKPTDPPPEEWLNYHHLHYFWRIARAGSLTRAAFELRLTHSTLSAQLKELERFFGAELFERRGRTLELTPFGAEVASRAEEIFRRGAELIDLARGRADGRRQPLRVGVVAALPKTLACRLLEPALASEHYRLGMVRQDSLDRLVEDLVSGKLHLVLSEAPVVEARSRKVFAHPLGASEVLLYGSAALARRFRRGFPRSLQGAPLLLPTPGSSLRLAIERWLAERDLRVHVEGEFDDAGLMRAFGVRGRGLFPVRAELSAEVEEHAVAKVGVLEGARERYYAISVDRRVKHPAVVALIDAARENLAAANSAR